MTDILLDVLRLSRTYIDQPSKWTQGCLAADEKGNSVNPRTSYATCWCVEGAIKRALSAYQLDEPNQWGAYYLEVRERHQLQTDAFRLFTEKAFELRLPGWLDVRTAEPPGRDVSVGPAHYNDSQGATYEGMIQCLDACIAAVAEHSED